MLAFVWAGIGECFGEVWIEGTSQPEERITISSPVEEIVETVPVREGQVVEKGETLATLLATREQLEVKRLSFLLKKAEDEAKTARDLFSKGIQKKSELINHLRNTHMLTQDVNKLRRGNGLGLQPKTSNNGLGYHCKDAIWRQRS